MSRQQVQEQKQAAATAVARIRADAKRAGASWKPVLVVIEKRFLDSEFNVDRLWNECGVRDKNAAAHFAAAVGKTPWAYVTDRRLEIAARLLVRTKLKPWQIALAVGYANPDTFGKAFKRWCDRSPAEHRRDPPREMEAEEPSDGGDILALALAHVDPEELRRAVAGRLAPESAERLYHRLGSIRARLRHFYPRLRADASTGDFDRVVPDLEQVGDLVRKEVVRDLALEVDAYVALAYHARGAARTACGDLDRAYSDLESARRRYAAVEALPPEVVRGRRDVPVSCDTDSALLEALCPSCRDAFASETGTSLRRHLRQALALIPRDLEWFESCCDDCYRVVWQAVTLARLGLIDDAWQAWWLVAHADPLDPKAPPSRGRVIAALAESERRTFKDQEERRKYCQIALDVAIALGDPVLEAEARIYLGNALQVMGEFSLAREELAAAAPESRHLEWLAAFRSLVEGVLETHTNGYPKALERLQEAYCLYEPLDPHMAGRVLIELGEVFFFTARYEKSIAANQDALSVLDQRRDAVIADAGVPINLAVSFALLKRWDMADEALSRCHFDREEHGGVAAAEVFTRACLELGRGRVRRSLPFFDEAMDRFEKLHRSHDVALAASYCVEAYARLGDRSKAIENATTALRFFQAAGCTQDTVDALGKILQLVTSSALDAEAIRASVRRLARHNGGWLPELKNA